MWDRKKRLLDITNNEALKASQTVIERISNRSGSKKKGAVMDGKYYLHMKGKSYTSVFGFLIAATAFISAGCGTSSDAANTTAEQPATVDVTAAQAVIKPIPSYIEATGSLDSDAKSDVAPTIQGKVVAVNFDIGSANQGDVLVQLDARCFIRLEQARHS